MHRTSERQPSKAFMLWSLSYDRLHSVILSLLLTAWKNAKVRLAAETDSVQTVLDKVRIKIILFIFYIICI